MRYAVILADPPWSYRVGADVRSPSSRRPSRHYDTMPTHEIARLPVGDLAAEDCALFLWVTYPILYEAHEVIRAWGFAFKTCAFTWVKLNRDGSPWKGLGAYTRANAELCLLCAKGHPHVKTHDVPQVILSRRREHSRKPDIQYERIERLFDGPWIELFARQHWPGWETAFSNQDHKFLAQPPLLGERTTS